jgi:hypothetical protein
VALNPRWRRWRLLTAEIIHPAPQKSIRFDETVFIVDEKKKRDKNIGIQFVSVDDFRQLFD